MMSGQDVVVLRWFTRPPEETNMLVGRGTPQKRCRILVQKRSQKTRRNLELSADNLELAFSWTGQKLNTATGTTIKKAHALSGMLAEAADWTRAQVGKELDTLSKEVKKLREEV